MGIFLRIVLGVDCGYVKNEIVDRLDHGTSHRKSMPVSTVLFIPCDHMNRERGVGCEY